MKLSISTGSLYLFPLNWIFGLAAGAGFEGVELALGHEAVWRGSKTVLNLAQKRQLPIFSVHPPLFSLPGWDDIADARKIIHYAAEIGASVVVQHTPPTRSLNSQTGVAWQRATEEARRLGQELGVALALENLAIFRPEQRDLALADPEQLYRYAEENDFPLTLDTAHAATWPYDVIDLYRLYRDRLVNLHFSDFKEVPAWLDRPQLHSYIKHHQLPGAGDLPLHTLIQQASADGYTGFVTLEISPLALQAWWPARLRKNLSAMVAFVQQNHTYSASKRPKYQVPVEGMHAAD